MFAVLATIGLLVAGGILAVVLLVRRGLEVKSLAERGQPTMGQVESKAVHRGPNRAGKHRRVKLSYERPDTGRRTRWITVSEREWESLVEGGPVELIYLPERPSVFATRALVQQARETLKSIEG